MASRRSHRRSTSSSSRRRRHRSGRRRDTRPHIRHVSTSRASKERARAHCTKFQASRKNLRGVTWYIEAKVTKERGKDAYILHTHTANTARGDVTKHKKRYKSKDAACLALVKLKDTKTAGGYKTFTGSFASKVKQGRTRRASRKVSRRSAQRRARASQRRTQGGRAGMDESASRMKPFAVSAKRVAMSSFDDMETFRKALSHVRSGRPVGFRQEASLKSMGLIPRADGMYRLGKKYHGV